MIRNIFYLLLVTIVFFTSCTQQAEDYSPPEMVKEIKPSIENDDFNDGFFSENSLTTNNEKPFIDIPQDEVLINTMNINLDLDSQDEQILIMKKRDNPEGPINIAVADYDNVKNSYVRAWESSTSSESIRAFDIHLEDIVGDHNSEIICSGRNSEGLTTLDVFRKSDENRRQLDYKLIFSQAAMGSIEINQTERSRAYHQGLKDGVSYTITVTKESDTSGDENSFNLIESKYYWDFPLRQYLLLSEELIENDFAAEKQIETIAAGDEQVFYDYISGPWQFEDLIIYFDPENETATFFTDDIQENYSWVNSYKVLSNLLYIRCRNEIINYIENEIYVRIVDLDQVRITVRDIDSQTHTKEANDIWSNDYFRMNREQQDSTIKKLESVIDNFNLPELTGQYISDSGDIIEFYGTDFYIRSSIEELKGGFAVYAADTDILSLKIIDENGIVTEERSFSIEYTEERKEQHIERTIVLTPGKLSIHGFHPSDTEFYRYTQIETLEMYQEEDQ